MTKRILMLFGIILLIASLTIGCTTANSTSSSEDTSLLEVKNKGKFVLGLDDSFPPMGFRDENGQIIGFDIDLAKEVAKRMGVELEVKPIDWDGKVLSLNNKDIDVIWNGLTITEDRKKEIGFSKVYLENRQIIIVRNDSDIATKSELAGKKVGLQLGSSSQDALSADPETEKSIQEVVKYANNTEALLDLTAERIDAVIVDEIVGRYYIAKRPGEYKVADEDFGRESYGIGFRKGEKAFIEEVDKLLDEMKADGTTEKISKEWFGEDIVVR